MKIFVNEHQQLELTEVYNNIVLKSNDNEIISICMRDSGFEFSYNDTNYSAKNNVLEAISSPTTNTNKKVVTIPQTPTFKTPNPFFQTFKKLKEHQVEELKSIQTEINELEYALEKYHDVYINKDLIINKIKHLTVLKEKALYNYTEGLLINTVVKIDGKPDIVYKIESIYFNS
jgi:hypothetical protein